MDEFGLLSAGSYHKHQDNSTLFGNVGEVYYKMGEYRSALDYYNKSLHMYKAIFGTTNHPKIALTYMNMGNAYNGLGEYRSALEYYNKSLEMYKSYI